MGLDPSAFTSETQRGMLRSSLFRRETRRLQNAAALNSPANRVSQFRQNVSGLATSDPIRERVSQFRQNVVGVGEEFDGYNADARSKAGAWAVNQSMEPTPEEHETAVGAIARLGGGGLNTVLNVLDAPRKWTFENLVVPAVKRMGLVAPDQALDPTGYAVFMKAMGGQAFQQGVAAHLRAMGADRLGDVPVLGGLVQNERGASGALAEKLSGAAGFGLDVLLDPLNYATLGAGGLAKAGGRALAMEGKALVGGLRAGTTLAEQAPELRRALGGVLPEVVSGVDLSTTVKLTEPQIDEAMKLLRGTGVQSDLFERGGLRWRLPFNSAELSLPMLNREEQIGLFLGGREVTPSVARAYDGIRRSMIDLGEAALSQVPLPIKQAAGAVAGGVRQVFVPYHYLQGAGRNALGEVLKHFQGIPRSEVEAAARQTQAIFKGLDDVQRTRVQYHLDMGAVMTDPTTGRPLYESFDDFALRRLEQQGLTETLPPEELGQRLTEEVEGLSVRLGEQERGLKAGLKTVAEETPEGWRTKQQFASAPEIARRNLAGLRPDLGPGIAPGETAPAVRYIQNLIDRTADARANQQLIARHNTRGLVAEQETAIARRRLGEDAPLTTLEQIEPDKGVREALLALFAVESADTASNGVKGPVAAIMQYALDSGQGATLQNYFRHIRNVDAPSLAKKLRDAPPQLGIRKPANIGKQRVMSFGAEPEELQALGYATNPEAVIAKTLAEYRTKAREGSMVRWTMENYGRRLKPGETPGEGEEIFKPSEWFTKGLPQSDELAAQLKYLNDLDELTEEEAEQILHFSTAQRGRGRPSAEAWVIPSDVKMALQENRKVLDNAGGWITALDGLLGVQRSLVTSIFPSYHWRNFVGNVFNSSLGGVSPFDYRSAADAAKLVTGKLDDADKAEIARLILQAQPTLGATMAATGPLGAAPTGDNTSALVEWLGRYLTERGVLRGGQTSVDVARPAGTVSGALGALTEGKLSPFKWGRTLSETTDNVARVRHVLGRVRKGDNLEEAVLSARKFLFDYSDLSAAERGIFKRATLFYTFTRKNIPLQLEMMLHEPRQYQYWQSAFRAAGDKDAEQNAEASLLPAFMREQLGIVLGQDENGQAQLLSGIGLPIEELNLFAARSPQHFAQKFLGLTNPLIQAVVNAAGTPSGFTGRAIDDDAYSNYYRQIQPAYGDLIKELGLANVLGIEERKFVDADGKEQSVYSGNPTAIYALYNLFSLGRVIRTGGDIGGVLREPSGENLGKFLLKTMTGLRVGKADLTRSMERLETSERSTALDEEINTGLDEVSRAFLSGDATASQWRADRGDLLSARADRRAQLLADQIRGEGAQLGVEGKQAVEKVRQSNLPEGARLLETIWNLEPGGVNPGTGARFSGMQEWSDTRSSLVEQLRTSFPKEYERMKRVQRQARQGLSPEARQLEEQYDLAKQLLDDYNQVPKYIGLSKEQARKVDEVKALQRAYASQDPPAVAKQKVARKDPEGWRLLLRARPNTKARQRMWDKLNRENGGVLDVFFRDLPLEEVGELVSPSPESSV